MVFDLVASVIADSIHVDVDEINEDTSFEDLGIDYIDLLDIAMAIEEQFDGIDIEIDDDILTVGELVEAVENCL